MPAISQIHTRIVPSAVKKVIDGNRYHYVGKVIVTLHDGMTQEYAIKTKPASFAPEQIKIRINGIWQDVATNEISEQAAKAFTYFLRLVDSCFGNKLPRNKLFLNKNKMLRDLTPFDKRMKYSSHISDCICLIDGNFVRKTVDGYYTMPYDMSTDWVEIKAPSFEFKLKLQDATAYYSDRLARCKLAGYHNDLVKQGIRI